MSWIERIQNDIVITTGDGKEYVPLYVKPTYSQEYNISEFNFSNVKGTYVKKGEPIGTKYGLDLYFHGENHIEQARSFKISCEDRRPCSVTHPLYDQILCHVASISGDDSKQNRTKLTVVFLETIENPGPESDIDLIESIESKKVEVDNQAIVDYEEQVLTITTADASIIEDSLTDIETESSKIVIGDIFFDIKNAVITAKNGVNLAVSTTESYFLKVQTAINFPFQIASSVKSRVDLFVSVFDRLARTVDTLSGNNDKKYLETSGATGISGTCVSSVNQIDDYPYSSRAEVLLVTEKIIGVYDTYVAKIDELQSESATSADPYIPNYQTLLLLQEIVFLTVSKLQEVALGSRQEREYVLEYDSDAINLAHRFYGMKEQDQELELFIETNQLTFDEHFIIKKGRVVKYYIG